MTRSYSNRKRRWGWNQRTNRVSGKDVVDKSAGIRIVVCAPARVASRQHDFYNQHHPIYVVDMGRLVSQSALEMRDLRYSLYKNQIRNRRNLQGVHL
jgi:hypothetical protein